MVLPHSVQGPGLTLDVTRVWPRPQGRLSLELRGGDLLAAGQLIPEAADAERIRAATAARAADPADVQVLPALGAHGEPCGHVLVQFRGADRRLRALPALAAAPGSEMLVHRPERRAVLRTDAGPYLRVVRPGRTEPLRTAGRRAAALLSGLDGIGTPRIVDCNDDDGVVEVSGLPGTTLRTLAQRLDRPELLDHGARGLGRVLRHLGGRPAPPDLQLRDEPTEIAWVAVWLRRVREHRPECYEHAESALAGAIRALADTQPQPWSAIHADLHDGQVLVDDAGGVGVLDWDTVAAGEGALDAGNVLAHLQLREVLGDWPANAAARLHDRFVEHWAPSDAQRQRAGAYRRLILVRLGCQYALRPGHDPESILDAAAAPG